MSETPLATNLKTDPAPPHSAPHIVILGGGFGGLYTARHLDRFFRRSDNCRITLISNHNYFLMTPFLFEAGSGVLEPRHAVNPVRAMFNKVRFVEATIDRVDFDNRKVFAHHAPDQFNYELDYDHLVLALGGVTNRALIPGSEHALGFKTLGDAIFLRNRMIDLFEQADIEQNPDRRRKLLTIVLIGGGLVGIELMGELTDFIDNLLRSYPRIPKALVHFVLIEAAPRMLPEMDEDLADYAVEVLRKRGVDLRPNTKVKKIEPERVFLPDQRIIEAKTILLAAGLGTNPLLHDFPLEKAKNGRIAVEPTMRCKDRPEVWALGDCASIPDPSGRPYPPLAQHALREARVLAKNIAAVIRQKPNAPAPRLQPFVYKTLGMLASLGHYNGVGRIMNFKIKGFLAWWVWRTYYVMQMPQWQRRLRVIIDWTIALFFKNDIVKLDLFGDEHPSEKKLEQTVAPPAGPALEKLSSSPIQQPDSVNQPRI